MPGIDACVSLLEIPVCCVLKEKQSEHDFEGNLVLVLVLFRFASCFFLQMTPTENRKHHIRNLVHGKLAVDETSSH